MNLRHVFTSQRWWGKVLGAFLGFLVAGPVGSLFGILIGNFFDRGLNQHFSNPMWHYHAEKRPSVKNIFLQATFSIMGHIAKADGRVSKQEIQLANQTIQHMNLNKAQKKAAQHFFNEGKKEGFKLKQMIVVLNKATRNNPNLLKLFLDIQYKVARLDGLSEKKIEIMNTILNYTQHAPIHEQSWFHEKAYSQSYEHQSNHSYQNKPNHDSHLGLTNAFRILEVQPMASKQEVKRAYKRLMSKHHPDKLIAQGLSKERIKSATEKTQLIAKAYNQICTSKGW